MALRLDTLKLFLGLNVVISVAAGGTTTTANPNAETLTEQRGSRIQYQKYEAEDDGRCTGMIVGPTTTAYTDQIYLGSEASQRMACQLEPGSASQTVSFTITSATNALRIRYSIPDAPTGGGTRTMLEVDVTGQATTIAMLTSEFSYYYGTYPFTNNPNDGKGHHFYDEVYVKLPSTIAAGTLITLKHPNNNTAANNNLAANNNNTNNNNYNTTTADNNNNKNNNNNINSHTTNNNNYNININNNSNNNNNNYNTNNNNNNTAARAHVLRAPSVGGCQVNPVARTDCGFNGITKANCEQRGCCFLVDPVPNPNHYPYCYNKSIGPSPPSPPSPPPTPPSPPPSPSPPPPPPSPPIPPTTNAAITIDVIDAYLIQPPSSIPQHAINIVDYGADPTGINNSAVAFNKAMAVAVSKQEPLWVPCGIFQMESQITLPDHVTIVGTGAWHSELHWKSQKITGLFGRNSPGSNNVTLRDFAIRGEIRQRCDDCPASGIGGAIGNGSVISGLIIQHTKVGMWLDGPFGELVVSENIISDTAADGINLHGGITHVTIVDNHIRNTGDDGIALWSQKTIGADRFNTIKFNTVELPILANCVALYGGGDHTVTDNLLSDTVMSGGALHVGNRFSSVPLFGQTLLSRNTLIRGGCLDENWKTGVGSLWFYSLEASLTGAVVVSDTLIIDSSYEALHVTGPDSISNVVFRNVFSNTTATFFLQLQTEFSATFENVNAVRNGYFGIYDCEPASKVNLTMIGDNNTGWNTTHCGFPPSPPPL